MENEKIIEKLGNISNDLNGVIGRLSMISGNSKLAEQSLEITRKVAKDIDELIWNLEDEE